MNRTLSEIYNDCPEDAMGRFFQKGKTHGRSRGYLVRIDNFTQDDTLPGFCTMDTPRVNFYTAYDIGRDSTLYLSREKVPGVVTSKKFLGFSELTPLELLSEPSMQKYVHSLTRTLGLKEGDVRHQLASLLKQKRLSLK